MRPSPFLPRHAHCHWSFERYLPRVSIPAPHSRQPSQDIRTYDVYASDATAAIWAGGVPRLLHAALDLLDCGGIILGGLDLRRKCRFKS